MFALVDTAGNGTYRLVTVLSGIENPNGLAWRKGSLYVSGFAREGTKDIGVRRGMVSRCSVAHQLLPSCKQYAQAEILVLCTAKASFSPALTLLTADDQEVRQDR